MYHLYKSLKPQNKDDMLIAHEISENSKSKPLTNVYVSKRNIKFQLQDSKSIHNSKESEHEDVILTENKFTNIPIIKHNETNAISYFIAGVSGSGKSYYTATLINNLLHTDRFKKADVYLISSQVADDPAYQENIKKYFKLDINHEDFYSLKFSDFKDSIVIFDDVTSMANREQERFIFNLQKGLVENARKNNVALINISHQSRDFTRTKYIIHESNYYVLFPSASWNDSKKFLKGYLDYDEDQLREIKNLSRYTRSITIHKSNPQYLIADHMIKLL